MLAIVTTHPIQYQVPLWRALADDGRVPFEVWYLTHHGAKFSRDREFGVSFAWDLDMLSGYPHRLLNVPQEATPNNFWNCRLRERLRDRIRASGASAVWIQGWNVAAYWQAATEAKIAGAEVWLRAETNDLAPRPLWKELPRKILLQQLFRRVNEFLYIGIANRRFYEKFGIPNERLHHAPYAVDNERFAKQAEAIRSQMSEIRRQWSIQEDAFCVLFCGKFIPKKRPKDLVRVAQALITSHPSLKLHLLFVGSGELGDELRRACNVVFDAEAEHAPPITHHSSLPNASFTGFLNQTEISRAYVAADCLLLPSDYGETWGLVVNEAMASGLPCIISDHSGCAADLGKSNGNTTFACGNITELSERITQKKFSDAIAPHRPSSLEETRDTVIELVRVNDVAARGS